VLLPNESMVDALMAQFNKDVATILPEGFEPVRYTQEGEYYWFRITANNSHPNYQIYRHVFNDPLTVVVGGIHAMPGCCGACIITGIGVTARFQRKGLGTMMGQFLLKMGARYSQAIGTIVVRRDSTSEPSYMEKLATKLGFEVYPSSRFQNRNTDNYVVTCARRLPV
jgi:GNAT superfamily N-acetyltransferase